MVSGLKLQRKGEGGPCGRGPSVDEGEEGRDALGWAARRKKKGVGFGPDGDGGKRKKKKRTKRVGQAGKRGKMGRREGFRPKKILRNFAFQKIHEIQNISNK